MCLTKIISSYWIHLQNTVHSCTHKLASFSKAFVCFSPQVSFCPSVNLSDCEKRWSLWSFVVAEYMMIAGNCSSFHWNSINLYVRMKHSYIEQSQISIHIFIYARCIELLKCEFRYYSREWELCHSAKSQKIRIYKNIIADLGILWA